MHLLLHIGPPKTGSTAIQESLFLNTDKLKRTGIMLFPPERGDLPQRALIASHSLGEGFDKSPLQRKFETPEAAREWSAMQWESLADAVRQSEADLCVISSEHFSYSTNVPELLAAFRRIFSGISMLSYARDPVPLYFSRLQQNIRGGVPLQRIKTPLNFKFRLRKTTEQFLDVLGPENVTVRNFARDNLKGGDVVQDFFAHLERFDKTVSVDTVRVNESLPGAALALLMLMNEAAISGKRDKGQRQVVQRLARSDSVARLPPFRPKMPLANALIRSHTTEDCDWINRVFLSGQKPLPTERPLMPSPPSDSEWRAQMRDELLDYLTPEALAVLGQEMVRL